MYMCINRERSERPSRCVISILEIPTFFSHEPTLLLIIIILIIIVRAVEFLPLHSGGSEFLTINNFWANTYCEHPIRSGIRIWKKVCFQAFQGGECLRGLPTEKKAIFEFGLQELLFRIRMSHLVLNDFSSYERQSKFTFFKLLYFPTSSIVSHSLFTSHLQPFKALTIALIFVCINSSNFDPEFNRDDEKTKKMRKK